jgi:hypothetical protein
MFNGSRPLALFVPLLCSAAMLTLPAQPARAAADDVETLVFVRHGEKPAEGLGQLTCQGLNRALALPAVIAAKFGKPDAIYAPDPGEKKNDHGHAWYYVRPLATIEPTAIQFGLPVQTPYGHSQSASLAHTLIAPEWRGRTALIAWEHHDIVQLVRKIVAGHGGDAADVPDWPGDDYDSIYVVRIDWSADRPRAKFTHDREGLDGRSTDCPCAALPAAPQ